MQLPTFRKYLVPPISILKMETAVPSKRWYIYKVDDTAMDKIKTTKTNSAAIVRKRTIPTERPPLVGEI
jgi:hypothetical protein